MFDSLMSIHVDRVPNADQVTVSLLRYSEPEGQGQYTKCEYLNEALEWCEFSPGGYYLPMLRVPWSTMVVSTAVRDHTVDALRERLQKVLVEVATDVTDQSPEWAEHEEGGNG